MTNIGLPARPFLYTVDQISVLTQLSEQTLHSQHIFHEGRDVGVRKPEQMLALNYAAPNEKPDWRIPEAQFIAWMRKKGYKFYDRKYSGRGR